MTLWVRVVEIEVEKLSLLVEHKLVNIIETLLCKVNAWMNLFNNYYES